MHRSTKKIDLQSVKIGLLFITLGPAAALAANGGDLAFILLVKYRPAMFGHNPVEAGKLRKPAPILLRFLFTAMYA
ncbi:MAG: hypothetical protein ACR2P1_00220, partial [Pseudomonadales bacterium]